MRKAFRHSGVLMMLAVVALGLLGAAYTLWYEKLTLSAEITTGELNADWSFHSWSTTGPTDNGSFAASSSTSGNGAPVVAIPPAGWGSLTSGVATLLGSGGNSTSTSYGLFDYNNFYVNGSQKPLTTCTGAIGSNNSPGQANDVGDNNTLTLTMGGLFPYAGCEFAIDLHNDGTVPFHIAITGLTVWQCPVTVTTPGFPDCNIITDAPWSRGFDPADDARCKAFFGAEWPWTGPKQINDSSGNAIQIHPGSQNDLLCHFKLVLDQNPNAENQKFFVNITYATYQWNESPALPF
jgi:hypothetical protein